MLSSSLPRGRGGADGEGCAQADVQEHKQALSQLCRPGAGGRAALGAATRCHLWLHAVLCEVIGAPIKRLAELFGEPIKLAGKRALRKALAART